MKVDHITVGGSQLIRDTSDISLKVRQLLDVFQFGYESRTVTHKDLPFSVKITATNEGCVFDIVVNGGPAIMNLCSFSKKHRKGIIDLAKDFNSQLGLNFETQRPRLNTFIYSFIVNPFIPSDVSMIAGEVELYIYDQIHKAWKNNK